MSEEKSYKIQFLHTLIKLIEIKECNKVLKN